MQDQSVKVESHIRHKSPDPRLSQTHGGNDHKMTFKWYLPSIIHRSLWVDKRHPFIPTVP